MTHDAINDYKHLEREVKALDFSLCTGFCVGENDDRNPLAVRNSVSLRIGVIGGRATRGNDTFALAKNALNNAHLLIKQITTVSLFTTGF